MHRLALSDPDRKLRVRGKGQLDKCVCLDSSALLHTLALFLLGS